MAELGRLLTAMITPFDEDQNVDYPQARKLAKGLLDSGTDGLVIGGTTGESPSMSDDEKIRLFAEVKEEIGIELPDGDYETISGFVLEVLGHIPVLGEQFEYDSWKVEVTDVEGVKIKEVRLTRVS